jgi:hypothetical protein
MAGVELAAVIFAIAATLLVAAGTFAIYRAAARQAWGSPLLRPRVTAWSGGVATLAALPLAAADVGAVSAVFLVLSVVMLAAVALPYLAVWRRGA